MAYKDKEKNEENYEGQYAPKIEAVLFVSGNPVPFEKLCEIFELPPDIMEKELEFLEQKKAQSDSGLSLIKLDGAYQLCTKQETSESVKRFLEMKKSPPLSKAALEVLAITAYHQPVTRSFIEHVRGIESSSIVAGLEDKGLIAECGHLDAPGRPVLFATTEAFLRSFGLESIDALPPLPEEFVNDNGQISLEYNEENASDSKTKENDENSENGDKTEINVNCEDTSNNKAVSDTKENTEVDTTESSTEENG